MQIPLLERLCIFTAVIMSSRHDVINHSLYEIKTVEVLNFSRYGREKEEGRRRRSGREQSGKSRIKQGKQEEKRQREPVIQHPIKGGPEHHRSIAELLRRQVQN
jgi:hypothetical protein